MAQDWDTLIALARMTKGKEIDYYVIGEGMMKSYLEDRVKEYCLDNIRVLPYQPRELMPRIIAFSDIQFIFYGTGDCRTRISVQGLHHYGKFTPSFGMLSGEHPDNKLS